MGTLKSLTEHLWFNVPDRRGYLNITDTVEELVRKSAVREGICLVNAMHSTKFSRFLADLLRGLRRCGGKWRLVVRFQSRS